MSKAVGVRYQRPAHYDDLTHMLHGELRYVPVYLDRVTSLPQPDRWDETVLRSLTGLLGKSRETILSWARGLGRPTPSEGEKIIALLRGVMLHTAAGQFSSRVVDAIKPPANAVAQPK